MLVQPVEQRVHVGDARHHDEALAAAMMFAQQRLADHHIVPLDNVSPHRKAVHRRGLDGGKLAQAGHRHLQRARNGRGGQREHVHVRAQLLQLFLVGHAETLFLVDDHEAQILELGRLGEDRVGADHDVHRAVGQRIARLAAFLGRNEPAEPPDLEREAREAFGEMLEMLAREQRGRRDDCDLLAAHRRDECGTQRNLGLAEADIAADQPVHRLATFQIAQHIGDRALLILGLLPRETVDELVVAGVIGLQHGGLLQRALRGGAHQLAGDLADAFAQLGAAFLPCLAAQPVKHDRILAAAIAGEDF